MSAGTALDEAHRSAAKALGRLSVMLALGKANRALISDASIEFQKAARLLDGILAATPAPAPKPPQSKLDTLF